MKVLIVSTALRPGSKTSLLARTLADDFRAISAEADLLDLAETPLPQCDGASCYADPAVKAATDRVHAAQAVVLCSPVYNYQLNSAAKNFVELTNEGWENHVVGCVVNAGGERSYLAPLPLLNSLMVDHRCLIVPRFVYVTSADFTADGALDPQGNPRTRLSTLAAETAKLTRAWAAT